MKEDRKERRFTHLTWNDRLKIERMLKQGYTNQEIADAVRVSVRTIFREKKRGLTVQMDSELVYHEVYCADTAQRKYERNLKAKGPELKIANDHELANYLESKIADEGYSPDAALMSIKTEERQFKTSISKWTLYSYIDKGVFLRVTNKDLPVKGKRKETHHKVRRAARPAKGDSIETRPAEVETRETFGHWEMDSVVGKKKTRKRLLVLTERKTRDEISILLDNGKAESVVNAINNIEKKIGVERFKAVFKTITVDNGTEFADYEGIQNSCLKEGPRTHVYYCHPYSSFERGSNENHNKLIRRKKPKGSDFTNMSQEEATKIANWMNNYPRRTLNGKTPHILLLEELHAIGIHDLMAS